MHRLQSPIQGGGRGTRECLAIEADTSLPGLRVRRILDGIIHARGRPEVIVTDNGPELANRVFDQWCYQRRIRHHFIQPGKPMQISTCEGFNGSFRDECLNEHWLRSFQEARRLAGFLTFSTLQTIMMPSPRTRSAFVGAPV